MELRVLEKTDTELRIEVADEDHTFMNVLKGELLQTEGVAAATYDMNPEQSGGQTEPILSITTETGFDPLDALEEASNGVSDRMTTLYDELDAGFAGAA
ncbi:DNA-directed RNA polymerase subunit L [Candidatus Halobonum tyrrellensis]|uniref:DNA-directed RNA polymerase subunit Rpo11 n=1 Tax=Candidatus Halobonum tyrrellensis G22 TaxID=1324957 RepID=V4HP03_9EURY|nr:DNA-directed RNA polymerase subunit L [Candidatus Halobonum tyrrellensis]ESP89649.1 DNA-directed RNA polymerase subunit L [Candidatus Halobonum tyrrellensis G22]